MTSSHQILCVSGWAQPHDALRVLSDKASHLDYHDCQSLEEALELIAGHSPATAIGWSLGGWLLMRAIEKGLVAPKQLVLLAPPLQYVSSPDFPYGMDNLTFRLFAESYEKDPARTSKRFSALIAKGDSKFSEILNALGYWEKSAEKYRWSFWLDVLEEQKHHHLQFKNFPPTLLIHGKQDVIIPYAQGKILAERIPGSLIGLKDAGHAPHLHDPEAIRFAIYEHAATHNIKANL